MDQLSILLVEDNFVNQKLAMAYFKKMGLEIDLAENGLNALEMVQKKKYQFIFMDLQMPEMDGFEATLRIRQMEDINQPVIVAMTANVFNEDKERCKAVGMDDFLGKPVRQQDIEQIIAKFKDRIC